MTEAERPAPSGSFGSYLSELRSLVHVELKQLHGEIGLWPSWLSLNLVKP